MTVVCKTKMGWFIDHLLAVDGAYTGHQTTTHYSLKSAMFDMQCPFMMDSQFEKWHKLQETQQTPQTKKRKRRIPDMSGGGDTSELKELVERLSSAHKTLVAAARQHGHLLERKVVPSNNNTAARLAASLAGPGDRLAEVAESWSKGENSWQSPHLINDSGTALSMADVFHRRVTYKGDNPVVMCLDGHHYLIPPRSSFVMSDFNQLLQNSNTLQVPGGYDLIVVDPPWQNKSVKRKRSYYSLEEESLLRLPVADLASPSCLIVTWVTNKPRLTSFVQDQLLPHWGVQQVMQWHWVKVTVDGTMVCDIASPTKKPYETLLLGRLVRKGGETTQEKQGPPVTSGHSSSFVESLSVKGVSSTHHDQHTSVPVTLRADNSNTSDQDLLATSRANDSDVIDQYVAKVKEYDSSSLLQSSKGNNSHVTHGYLSEGNVSDLPDNRVILSVPCSLHSKKPPLQDVLAQYLPPTPACLELFARNLWPDWVSWGHEVLKHQHLDYFEEKT
ncbi:N(6)-adenine-specific methyltransferase METTL4-like isoform X1 [Haliotis rufescens]|uniref:N(6)-adenine-specific methyltransferase METTL4-like isoform X1 n=1 Tax=Haliotis rufescens TaxID=6454 RepID=UPI00201E7988|nr:N(6)-adenine-specific methyltransferase METTL4-like isoform X1 [Haliotis rufescens]XP_048256058.1 N(6)-adenine-specific methyltransferase METTL4-like isoform X1 [Haliotis rufescens]